MRVPAVKAAARAVPSAVVVSSVFGQETTAASSAYERRSAASPIHVLASSVMFTRMGRARDEYEVRERIIGLIAVDVMHQFNGFEWASEMFAHYQTVFGDIPRRPALESVRMIGAQQVDVAVGRHEPATFPMTIAASLNRSVCVDVSAFGSARYSPQRAFAGGEQLPASAFARDVHMSRIVARSRQVERYRV